MFWLKRLVALFWSAPETPPAAVNTKQPAQPSTPAKAKRKYVRKAAPSTKAEASPKPVQKVAPAKRGQTGKSVAAPARKTRQHAK
jgi:hypothetical protein